MLFNFFRKKIINFQNYKKEKNRILKYKLEDSFAIELENISMNVKEKILIDNFNFKFKKNKIYGIVGKSGSGKSILADHFNGLKKSKNGNVYFYNGEKILFFKNKIKNYIKIRKSVGMVTQFPEYQLFKDTVLADVAYGPKMLGFNKNKIINKSKETLIMLGMKEEFFESNPFMLSGGQKRKVALAGILVIDPNIIIFDEPTIGLDPVSEQNIIKLILKLKKKNKTIIVISNNMNLNLELCDELLVLDKAKLIDYGDPYEIFQTHRNKIGMPKVIKFIEKLIKLNSKFNYLWTLKPKNVKELAKNISLKIKTTK